MNDSEKLQYLWNTYNVINDMVRLADAKAGAVLTANIATITIGLANRELIVDSLERFLFRAILCVIGSLVLLSCISSLRCLLPTLNVGNEPNSTIFFAHIASRTDNLRAYQNAVTRMFEQQEHINQLTEQIWANSKVAWKKYKHTAWAIKYFAGVLASSGFMLVALTVTETT